MSQKPKLEQDIVEDVKGAPGMLTRRRVLAWITALRSGKYKQGKGQLRCTPERQTVDGNYVPDPKNREYCCLGVLAQISPPVRATVSIDDDGALPSNVLPDVTCGRLIKLNDSESRSFKFIAKFIEKNILPNVPAR
jgi:hypothetical protein